MFYAGMNVPGYAPATDVWEFETFDDAKQYIIEEIKYSEGLEGTFGSECEAEELCHLAEDVNLESKPFTTPCIGDYIYWVIRDSE